MMAILVLCVALTWASSADALDREPRKKAAKPSVSTDTASGQQKLGDCFVFETDGSDLNRMSACASRDGIITARGDPWIYWATCTTPTR